MTYTIGIDGGGTSSRLRIVDENRKEVITVKGLSTNIYADQDNALKNIRNLILDALEKTSINASDVKSLCLGSAGLGMGRRADDEMVKNIIRQVLPNAKIKVTTDAHILLTGSLEEKKPGMILIAGTGSVALGRNKDRIIRSGGLGWRLGDEGSAWWVSKEAIYRVYAQSEKRSYIDYEDTSLRDGILKHFGLSELGEFVSLMNSNETTKSYIATGAKVVTENAKKGDLISLDILQDAATELLKLVTSLTLRLGDANYSLVIYGGEFDHDEILLSFFKKGLEQIPNVKLTESEGSALDGAVMEAFINP